MKSFAFPDFLTSTQTIMLEDNEATASNVKLSLLSQKKELFGDPDFGSNLILLLHEQNDSILIDIVIDYIYSNICTFIPQLYVERNDIKITQDGDQLYASFKGVNQLNFTTNLYYISLTTNVSK